MSAASASTAARALAEQCLRGLQSSDPARRAQAARHLAAVPSAAAAPMLAGALHAETDAKARAQIARALAACGGETALELVAARLASDPSPLVRLAALDALAGVTACADAALETASRDPSPALRRRAAALAGSLDAGAVLARLVADEDATVRAACAPREAVAVAEVLAAAPAARTEPASSPGASIVQKAGPAKAMPPVRIATPPPPAAAPGDEDAILAVQSAIFGLTEDELAARTGLDAGAARALAGRLVAQGRLGRRGKRLVIAEGGAA
jgi:hypothetical protein